MLHLLGRQEEALATYDGVIDSCRTIAAQQDGSGYHHAYPLQSRTAEAMVRKADLLVERGEHAAAARDRPRGSAAHGANT
jgi:hypothetical protein